MKILLHNPGSMLVITMPSTFQLILLSLKSTAIAFLDADAPWDTPHPHTINVVDSSNKIVYTTGRLDYTNSSAAKILPVGHYTYKIQNILG